jgi:thiamine pyrophosphate-dependent acetolactate synthase large subunit-like protein
MVHDPAEVPELVAQAFTVFRSRRPRPVHIAIPLDVMEMRVEDDWQPYEIADLPIPSPAAIDRAAQLLAQSTSCIMMVGGGAQQASTEVTALAERLCVGVIASNAGKGVVADSNPLSLGGAIISPAAHQYLAKAEVVLAIGTELAEADSFIYDLPIKGKIIRIDIDPARFSDAFPAHVAIQGDAGSACSQLLEALAGADIARNRAKVIAELDQVRAEQQAAFTDVERQHIRVLEILRSELPDDTVIMGDIAQLVYTGTVAMQTLLPRTWFYPAGFGTLGCALPDAIGAKLALPETTVIALAGDGGFMFTVNELATAVEEGLSIPIILWHNHSYAMIRDGMVKRGIPEIGVNPRAPDFVKLADAFGCPGTNVDSADGFKLALRDARNHAGPSLIIVTENDSWLG